MIIWLGLSINYTFSSSSARGNIISDLYDSNGLLNDTYPASQLHLIVNKKVLPGPSVLSSTVIVPPNSSTIFLQMFNPNPIPDVFIYAVASNFPNNVNSFFLSSGLMPQP